MSSMPNTRDTTENMAEALPLVSSHGIAGDRPTPLAVLPHRVGVRWTQVCGQLRPGAGTSHTGTGLPLHFSACFCLFLMKF